MEELYNHATKEPPGAGWVGHANTILDAPDSGLPASDSLLQAAYSFFHLVQNLA